MSNMLLKEHIAERWGYFMFHFLIWLLVVILYSPVFWNLYQAKWESIDYTHAYFILPLSLWLVWRKRKNLQELIRKPDVNKNLFSLFVFVFGMIMFIFASYQEYFSLLTLSFVFVIFGLIGFQYGRNVTKELSFPVFYLLLLVPPPLGIIDGITLPMRYGTSVMAEKILAILKYPISREGLLLTIGYNDIFMGEPCSGFRSLTTMFSLVLVYVYISKGKLIKKFFLTSFIIPFALLGNIIRVITLCLITFYFGEEAGQGFFHNFSGIVIFIITILGIIGIESLLDRKFSSPPAIKHSR